MRTLVAGSMVLLVACVKTPHEASLAYEEFDKAPDYVWRSYANAPAEDEAQVHNAALGPIEAVRP